MHLEPTIPSVLVLFASRRLGGPGKGLLQLVSASGHPSSFTICSFAHPDKPPSEFCCAVKAAGIQSHTIAQRFAFDPWMIRHTLDIAIEKNCEIVQSHGYKTHLLAALVSKRLGIPWLAVSHGWTDESLRIRAYNVLERMLLRLPDTVVAVSPVLQSQIQRLRPNGRTTTILNAIDRDRYAASVSSASSVRDHVRQMLGLSSDAFVLGVIGRLSPEKGQDQLLKAMAQLSDRLCPVAVFVGEGPAEKGLRTLAQELGLDGQVIFAGYQANVQDFFEAIDVVVLPSRSEGLPNVVLEAHAMKKPVVAFNVGGVDQVIEDENNGWLVEPEDTLALAKTIARVGQSPSEAREVGKRAYDRLLPKFSPEVRARAFILEYERLDIRRRRAC